MFTALTKGRDPAAADIEELNRFLHGAAYHRHVVPVDGHRLGLTPTVPNRSWVLAEIAASFGELLTEPERNRLKVCENPECQWAFYDGSRNRSRRWCDPSQCGNVFKVRQFRARQRARTTDPTHP